VLGLAGAAVAYGLDRDQCRRALILLARGGGVALLLGVLVGTLRWIDGGDLAADGASGLAITLYFLLGGFLFSGLGWFGRRASG
jgi:UDP-N-acetylmuramyl pentapeptide phosphotransferase/UDP-N-acetylglucosamine-1-phosphate transferase